MNAIAIQNFNSSFVVASSVVAVLSYAVLKFWPRKPKGLHDVAEVSVFKALPNMLDANTAFDVKYWKIRETLPNDGRRMYVLHIGVFSVAHVATPELAKQILDHTKFVKFIGGNKYFGLSGFGEYLFGNNIVISNDPDWSRHRSIVRHAFSRPLRTPPFITSASIMIRSLHASNNPIDIYSWMQRLTLDVLGRVIFSFDFLSLHDPEDPGKYVKLYNTMISRIFNPRFALFPFLAHLPTTWNKETWKMCKDFRSLLVMVIEDRMREQKLGNKKDEKEMDLLDMMLAAANENDVDFSMDDVVNNLLIFFVAGHDTTANILSLAIYMLAKHPDIQQKVRDEVYAIMGKPSSKEEAITAGLEHSQLGKLTYLNAVLKETMRLYPSVTAVTFRRAVEDVPVSYKDINGVERSYILPKGTIAAVDIYGMHHDPQYFPDPHMFNPNRWLDDTINLENARSWTPFGGGARICLGMQFSLVEQRVTMAMMLRNFEFNLTEKDGVSQELKLAPSALLRPDGLTINLKPIV